MTSALTDQSHFDIALIIDQTRLTQQAKGLEVSEHALELQKYHRVEIEKLKPQLETLENQANLVQSNIEALTQLLDIINKNRFDLRATILAHMAGDASLRETALDTQKKG